MIIPRNVLRFEVLLYLSLAIDALSFPFRATSTTATDDMLSTIKLATVVLIVVCLVLVWLAARQRQNWARWILVVLTALSGLSLLQMISAGSFDVGTSIDIITTALAAAGLYYSFTGDADGWFTPPSSGLPRS